MTFHPAPIRLSRGRRRAPTAAILSFLAALLLLYGAPTARAAPDPPTLGPALRGDWPLSPRPALVRAFDPPDVVWGAGHRGVDLQARVGQPVLAAADGVVGFAGPLAGRGVVTVVHGPVRTTYEPVETVVSAGQPVLRGEVIGHLQAGLHCGIRSCLHWGLLRGSQYLDPLSLIRRVAPRLLPYWGLAPAHPRRGSPSASLGNLARSEPALETPSPAWSPVLSTRVGTVNVTPRLHRGPAPAPGAESGSSLTMGSSGVPAALVFAGLVPVRPAVRMGVLVPPVLLLIVAAVVVHRLRRRRCALAARPWPPVGGESAGWHTGTVQASPHNGEGPRASARALDDPGGPDASRAPRPCSAEDTPGQAAVVDLCEERRRRRAGAAPPPRTA
jgi:murein DD-endopeptidase MepM/ murein hydrolase activator NlpD